jgi:Zn-dependent membrane protease YugP
LSPDVYHGNNASSAGVAAHEAGHAIQHAQGYSPMWVRSALVPMANIGSTIGPWVIIIGILLGAAEGMGLGVSLAKIGVALFGLATLFTLVTVPVEFDASSRAKKMLEQLSIVRSEEESAAVAGVLSAAGLTYVAAAINSLLMLLYWAYRAGLLGGRRSN